MLKTTQPDYLFKEVMDKLGVEMIVISKDRKAIPQEKWEFIKHCFMTGIFVNDLGGLRNLMEAPKTTKREGKGK